MAQEIERKFLLNYRPEALMTQGVQIVQGYMFNHKNMVVRLRLSDDNAFLTIKGKTVNASRKEFEYPIPPKDAMEMMALFCQPPLIKKTRYFIHHKGFKWELDQFSGQNEGLMIAEIELDHVDQPFEKPDWVGEEVTHDRRYFNSNLIRNPFSTWEDDPS